MPVKSNDSRLLVIIDECNRLARDTGTTELAAGQLVTLLVVTATNREARGALLDLIYEVDALSREPSSREKRIVTTSGGMEQALKDTIAIGGIHK